MVKIVFLLLLLIIPSQESFAGLKECQTLLSQLTGEAPISIQNKNYLIKNRSVSLDPKSDRLLAAKWIQEELKKRHLLPKLHSFGLQESIPDHSFISKLFNDTSQTPVVFDFHNISVTLPGTGNISTKKILMGAHYDTINNFSLGWNPKDIYDAYSYSFMSSPGADDNGSGVVGLFELIDRLQKNPISSDIEFVFFDGEESSNAGTKIGSQTYAAEQFSESDYKQIIILDMIGSPSRLLPQYYGFHSAHMSDLDLEIIKRSMYPLKGPQPYIMNQDHHGFLGRLSDSFSFYSRCSVPTVLISSVIDSHDLPMHYHTQKDLSDVINWQYFEKVLEHVESFVRTIVETP